MATFKLPGIVDEREAIVRRLESSDSMIQDLVAAFPDPGEAYVCSPMQLTFRQLYMAYMDTVLEEERHLFLGTLRRRSREERWMEKRAVFQAKRHSAKRDAILESEAQVWAVLGLEFHRLRLRAMWDRWEMLDAYVSDALTRLEDPDVGGAFTTNLRDAMKELRDVEDNLAEIMPKLGIPDRALKHWSDRAGSREELMKQTEGALIAIEGNEKAGEVFQLLDYIDAEGEDGGSNADGDADDGSE